MNTSIEAELLNRARNNDVLAYEALQVLLESDIRGFIHHLLGKHDAEDDIVQNTFFALFKNLERLDEIGKLRPFVIRVVRNQCYDHLRRQGRADQVSLDVDDYAQNPYSLHVTLPDNSPSLDDTTHWRLLYDRVMEAMATLPENQQQALILYTHEQLTYQEIADHLNISIGTVKSRIYHAKLSLKRLLDADILDALGISTNE